MNGAADDFSSSAYTNLRAAVYELGDVMKIPAQRIDDDAIPGLYRRVANAREYSHHALEANKSTESDQEKEVRRGRIDNVNGQIDVVEECIRIKENVLSGKELDFSTLDESSRRLTMNAPDSSSYGRKLLPLHIHHFAAAAGNATLMKYMGHWVRVDMDIQYTQWCNVCGRPHNCHAPCCDDGSHSNGVSPTSANVDAAVDISDLWGPYVMGDELSNLVRAMKREPGLAAKKVCEDAMDHHKLMAEELPSRYSDQLARIHAKLLSICAS